MKRGIGILSALWLVAGLALAQAPADPAGVWAWQVEGRNLMLLKIAAGGQGRLSGTLDRPSLMNLGPSVAGMRVSDVRGPLHTTAFEEKSRSEQGIRISFRNSDGRLHESVVRPDGQGGLLFGFFPDQDADMVAVLVRVSETATVPAEWDASRTFTSRRPSEPPNAELRGHFAADQADRQGGPGGVDGAKLQARDKARRDRVRAMLDAGLLRAAEDYYHAAYIFQHGGTSADYLLAHLLAMASMAMGRADASGIAAATLDRYLWSVDEAQVLGTQFSGTLGGQLTQGNYDQALVPDSLRKVLGVPTREQQEAQRQQINRQLPATGGRKE